MWNEDTSMTLQTKEIIGKNKHGGTQGMSKKGHLEVITGSMFCGKSEELIRRVKRAVIAKKQVRVFKPAIDNRYERESVATHDHITIEAIPIFEATDILKYSSQGTDVVAIDEVQFFDEYMLAVIDKLVGHGIIVIVSGLDLYATREPFGIMPVLMAKAKYVDKLHAVCIECGGVAHYTKSLTPHTVSKIDVGSNGKYIAVCENCFD
jgi:thymidine kinase